MKRLAVYDVNDYLMRGTDVGTLLGYVEGGLRPFIPVQQQPEFNEENPEHPYIVYRWRTSTPDDAWWEHMDELNYVIWGKDYDSLAEVANEILNEMRSLDQSAGDLNNWLSANRPDGVDYIFHWVRVRASSAPDAATQEGGRLGWLISLQYQYVPVKGKYIE